MSNPELPGYELLERLSGKSVWNVFKARQLSLNRMVVVKFLPAALLGDEGENKPFISETRRVALIKHPNIVQIYDFGRTGGAIAAVNTDGTTAAVYGTCVKEAGVTYVSRSALAQALDLYLAD